MFRLVLLVQLVQVILEDQLNRVIQFPQQVQQDLWHHFDQDFLLDLDFLVLQVDQHFQQLLCHLAVHWDLLDQGFPLIPVAQLVLYSPLALTVQVNRYFLDFLQFQVIHLDLVDRDHQEVLQDLVLH